MHRPHNVTIDDGSRAFRPAEAPRRPLSEIEMRHEARLYPLSGGCSPDNSRFGRPLATSAMDELAYQYSKKKKRRTGCRA